MAKKNEHKHECELGCKHSYEDLLSNNKVWAKEKLAEDPCYFEKLSAGQNPSFLLIGCSDSRNPMNVITKSEPGEVFLHRNVANQINLQDMNFLSVLEYSVEVLKVEHIIVCGHSRCGGVQAAYEGKTRGIAENWIVPIRDLARRFKKELDEIEDERERLDYLSKINAVYQTENLCKTSVMHKAFESGNYPLIHSWFFVMESGQITELDIPIEDWIERGILPEGYPNK